MEVWYRKNKDLIAVSVHIILLIPVLGEVLRIAFSGKCVCLKWQGDGYCGMLRFAFIMAGNKGTNHKLNLVENNQREHQACR